MSDFKIEEGKFYRTRAGRKVGPATRISSPIHGEWPWNMRDGILRGNDGKVKEPSAFPDSYDVIAEWVELTPHQERTLEMIEVMQAYVDGKKIFVNGNEIYEPTWNWIGYKFETFTAIPDSIDWSHIADEFICMARNHNGTPYVHERAPVAGNHSWTSMASARVSSPSYKRGNLDWKDSLVYRPGHEPKS